MRKEKLIQKIQAIDPSKKEFDALFVEIFSALQEVMPFHLGWFFPVDSNTLKRREDSLEFWADSDASIETGPLFLDEDLFPSVSDLNQKGCDIMRGEDCWTYPQLINHALYQKVLKSEGLFFSLTALVVDDEKKCIGYFVFWKKRAQGRFSEKVCRMLSVLLPEIAILLRRHSESAADDSFQKNASAPAEARLLSPIEKVSGIGEEELYSLIRRRAQPGILILNEEGEVLYLNRDGKAFLKGLTVKSYPQTLNGNGGKGAYQNRDGPQNAFRVVLPEIVAQLYGHFSRMVLLRKEAMEWATPTVNRICIHEGMVYLLRALLLEHLGATEDGYHFMILIERVSQGVRIDQIDWTVKLTPRESEVVQLLLEGKTNKEVAVCIHIGEYTVKDHIKRIMKKLEVTTRAGIVAKVLQHHFPS
ncbi:MAG: response regulator transcription factor [Nitrospiria bacterium]